MGSSHQLQQLCHCDVGRVTADITQVTSDIGQVTSDIGQVTGDMSCVTGDIGEVTRDTTSVTGDMSSVTNDIARVTNDITSVTNDSTNVTPNAARVTSDTAIPSVLHGVLFVRLRLRLQLRLLAQNIHRSLILTPKTLLVVIDVEVGNNLVGNVGKGHGGFCVSKKSDSKRVCQKSVCVRTGQLHMRG